MLNHGLRLGEALIRPGLALKQTFPSPTLTFQQFRNGGAGFGHPIGRAGYGEGTGTLTAGHQDPLVRAAFPHRQGHLPDEARITTRLVVKSPPPVPVTQPGCDGVGQARQQARLRLARGASASLQLGHITHQIPRAAGEKLRQLFFPEEPFIKQFSHSVT